MKFKIFYRNFLLLCIFLSGVLIQAQNSEPVQAPPSPDLYQTNNVGTVGPGAPASPIDDYIFLLLPLAIMMVVYFAYRYRKQLS